MIQPDIAALPPVRLSGDGELVPLVVLRNEAAAVEAAPAASLDMGSVAVTAVAETTSERHDRERGLWSRVRRFGAVVALAGSLAGVAACTGGGEEAPKAEARPGVEAGGAMSTLPEFDKSKEVKLLEGTWQYMQGVTVGDNGLKVERTDQAIRELDNQGFIPWTPINLYGTHVEMGQQDGEIGVSARMENINGKAKLSLQGDPTFRYDERIYRQAGIDIEANQDGTIDVHVFYGNGPEPDVSEQIKLDGPAKDVDVAVAQMQGKLVVQANDKRVDIPDSTVFESGQLWFGMDASNTWELSGLSAYPIGKNELKSVDMSKTLFPELDPKGLQALVTKKRPDMVIGTAVDLVSLLYDKQYADLVMRNVKSFEPEMLAKMQALYSGGKYHFEELDALVSLAASNGKEIHGHTLVFGEAYSADMEKKFMEASPEEAAKILEEYITTVVSRYNGKNGHGTINAWDVINEPFHPDDWAEYRDHMWLRKLGINEETGIPRYIEIALRAAHKANPDAQLYINDWALEHDPDRWGALIDLLNKLDEEGIPVHGVGFQAHLDPDDIQEILGSNIVAERFKQLEGMGKKARISEISVEGEDPELQAKAYAKMLRTAIGAKNCTNVNFWGLASNPTYFTTEPDGSYNLGPGQFGNDAPWTQNENGGYSRKPAANALFAVVS